MANLDDFGSYKAREKKLYEDFEKEIGEVSYPVYIISGEMYWKKYIVDNLSKVVGSRPVMFNDNVKDHLDKMRYRSLKRKKHFILFESKGGKLKEADFINLKEYLGNPSSNGILIIQLNDWKEKKAFLQNFRMITKSSKIKMFEMDYLSEYFKKLHIGNLLNDAEITFENDKLRNEVIRNMSLSFEELEDNILTLKSYEREISKDDYQESIEKYSDNTLEKLYESLAFLNRKKVPYEIVKDLLEEGTSPQMIIKGIESYFNYLYQAKYYRVHGLLRPGDIEKDKRKLIDSLNLNFKGKSLFDLSKKKRTKFLESCADITIKEILQIQMFIEEAYTTNRVEKKVEEDIDVRYIQFINKENLYRCLFNIMNRREEEEKVKPDNKTTKKTTKK